MRIVGIAACTAGIAHTYIAREKIMKAAQALGHEIAIETQGLAGTQNNFGPRNFRSGHRFNCS